jgi:hypothetical protein
MPQLLELGRYSADAERHGRNYQPAYWIDDVQLIRTGCPVSSMVQAIHIANARVRELAQQGV